MASSTKSRGSAQERDEAVAEDEAQELGPCVNCGAPGVFQTDGVEANPVVYCADDLPLNLRGDDMVLGDPIPVVSISERAARGDGVI